jgi:hypothetical protein
MSFIYVPTTTTPNVSGGAAGEVLYQSGVGATAFTAVGTAGQLLQSNGTSAPTWITPSSGSAMTLISTKTADNTASTITFTGLTGYNKYILVTSQLLCTATNEIIYLNFGYGATPTYITSGYYTVGQYDSSTDTTVTFFKQNNAGNTGFDNQTWELNSGFGINAFMSINNFINSPNNVTFTCQCFSNTTTSSGGTTSVTTSATLGGYVSMSSNAATAIKISNLFGSNFAQGTVSLYGISS